MASVSALSLLGTPDYSLQPVVTCNPAIKTAPHRTINSACFALPSAPGINGTYRFPYIHGPAFTDTDLTAIKDFKIRESQDVQFRLAANFINHADSSFNNSDAAGYETALNLSNNTAPPRKTPQHFHLRPATSALRRCVKAVASWSFR